MDAPRLSPSASIAPMNPSTPQHYRFGTWTYRPELRLLCGDEGEIRLKPLSDRLLCRLLTEPGKVLSRDRLIEEVWTRREVNDEVLSRAIAELRNLLGDDARQPRYIETLAKGGYRWMTEVQRHDELVAASAGVPAAPVAALEPGAGRRRWVIAGGTLLAVGLFSAWQLARAPAHVELRAEDLLHARPLTADPRLDLDPRFDPAGRIVYVRADGARGSELVMVSRQGSAERVLWQQPGLLRHPAVAPDANEVAVIAPQAERCQLLAISLLDGRRQPLADCAAGLAGALEWSADGKALLYTAPAVDADHAPGLAILDRATLTRRELTTPTLTQGAHLSPRLSPDQRHLVYASQHGADRQLWWTDWPQLREHQALLARPEPLYQHAFNADGSALWVAGDLVGYRALNRLAAGGEPELLGGRGAQSIDLHADGSAVWTEARYDADVWLGEAGQTEWLPIARSNRHESQPAFAPDGQSLALVSNRGGSETVLLSLQPSGEVIDLRLDPGRRWVRPSWSPDGASLVLSSYEQAQTRLYRYQLAEHRLMPIDGLPEDAFAAIELPDRLLFLSGPPEQRRLQQRLAGLPEAQSLPLGEVSAFRASAQWLVWRAPGDAGLRVARLDQWDGARLINDLDVQRPEAFAISGNRLCYAYERQLWCRELPDGDAVAVAKAPFPDTHGPSLALSATGRLAVSRLESLSLDLVIAEAPEGR